MKNFISKNYLRFLSLVILLGFTAIINAKSVTHYNVKDFGAKGDGKTLDSPAIDKAIEAAAKAGGGTVYVPAGVYLSGSIHLKSNIHLYLAAGSKILASKDNPGVYDPEEEPYNETIYQDGGHTYFHNSLIWGQKLNNVTISGEGMIDGEGLTKKGSQVGEGKYGKANKAICIVESNNVQIRDITIFRGGHFAILLTGCNLVTLDNLVIDTNRDGIDIDCCKNTVVSNCKVNSPYDDGICPKSSYALNKKIITENLTITNCQVSAFKMGTLIDGTLQPHPNTTWTSRSGRIKFGTESNGGFRNCVVSNCTFHSCKGLALEQVDGGVLENITISNIAMYNVDDYPIYIQLGERLRDPDKKSPSVGKNITISNVVAYVADSLSGIHISGTPRFILEDIRLSNINVIYNGGASEEAAYSDFHEIGESYPEISYFRKIVPSYGVFARHVKNLQLDNISVKNINPDMRPSMIMRNIDGLEIDRYKADVVEGIPAAIFEGVKNYTIDRSPVLDNIVKQ